MSRRQVALRALSGALFVYVTVSLVIVALQRKLLFPAPVPAPVDARAGSLVEGRSPRGRRVVALWSEAAPEAPVLAYFHGNGMQLADCAALAPILRREGWSLFAVEYPGYGPLHADAVSEDAIVDVAVGAMRLLRETLGVPRERTVLVGQSLGSGVATALAARGEGARLALLTPFTSVPDMAAAIFPWPGVRWMVRDRFDNAAKAPSITVPTLVVHGTRDEVVPYAQGQSLAGRFAHGRLVTLEGAHHNDLWDAYQPELLAALRGFVTPR